MELYYDNPIFVRTIRSKMRGKKTFLAYTGYILLICIIFLIIFLGSSPYLSKKTMSPQDSEEMGRALFIGLSITQALFLMIISPLLTSGVISIEKEKQTFELLSITSLSSFSILAGHFWGAIAYIFIMLISSFPLMSLCFMFGGVSPEDLILTYLSLFFASALFVSIGLIFTTTAKSTLHSNRSSASIPILLSFILIPLISAQGHQLFSAFAYLNPLALLPHLLGTPAPKYVYLYTLKLPAWIYSFTVSSLLIYTIILIASRKFYSDEERALSYNEFSIISFIVLLIVQGSSWKQTGSVEIFFITSLLLLVSACAIFSIGNDIKVLFFKLNGYIIYIIGIALISFCLSLIFYFDKGSISKLGTPLYLPLYTIIISFGLMMGSIGRLISNFINSRRTASVLFAVIFVLISGIIPSIAGLFISILEEQIWLNTLVKISPFVVIASITDPDIFNIISFSLTIMRLPMWIPISISYFLVFGIIESINCWLRNRVH